MFGIGEYPERYNARVHGPYNPGVNYDAPPGIFDSKIKVFFPIFVLVFGPPSLKVTDRILNLDKNSRNRISI